jgi:protein SCO1/2
MFNKMIRRQGSGRLQIIIYAVILIALFIAGFQISALVSRLTTPAVQTAETIPSSQSGAAVVSPPHRLQDFVLTSKTGDPISLADLRGKAVLLFFGYTNCPDVCPTTLADYRRVKQALGEQASEVEFVFISVDGARDTPDQMTRYLNQFDPEFIGMTGDEETMRRIGTEYGLFFSQEGISLPHDHAEGEDGYELDSQNYFVQHTSPSFLVDREGLLRLVYFYGTPVETITTGIRRILQETTQ